MIVVTILILLVVTCLHIFSPPSLRNLGSRCSSIKETNAESVNFSNCCACDRRTMEEETGRNEPVQPYTVAETRSGLFKEAERDIGHSRASMVLNGKTLPGNARRISWLVVHGTSPTDKEVATAQKHFPDRQRSNNGYGKENIQFIREDIIVESPIQASVYLGPGQTLRKSEVIHGVKVEVKTGNLDTTACVVIHELTFIPYLFHETNPFHFFGDTWHPIVPLVQVVAGQKAFDERDIRIFLTFKQYTRRQSWIARGWGMAGFYSELTRFPLQALGSIRKPVCFKDAVIGPGIGGRNMGIDVQFYLRRFNLINVQLVRSDCPRILLVQRQSMDESHFFDAGRTIMNIQAVDMVMRDAFGVSYLGSVAFELMPLATSLNFMRMADIVVVMHGAGHTMAAAFMKEGAWLLELSWACRGRVLKNTGKVIKGRKIYQKNYVVPRGDLSPVPRAFMDVGSHYVGSFLSGVSSPPVCDKMFPKPFHTLYGDKEFGYWCGKHELTHDEQYNDECRMNVLLNPTYLVGIVNLTRKNFRTGSC